MAQFVWLPADRRPLDWLTRLILATVWCLGVCTPTGAQVDPRATPESAGRWQDKSSATFHTHAIVTAHPLASEAGLRILRQGGSAVDAAIAAQLVLSLVEPQSSGLGGGAFLLLATGRDVIALDGRETAPQEADERLFLRPDGSPLPWADAVAGGRSVGTPGVLRLLELAHRQQGRLRWSQLFEPAIRLAEQGFAISPRLHQAISEQAASLRQDPAAASYFFDRTGQVWPVGHRLRNPDLARTLRHLARVGADGFYQGSMARALVQRVREHPRNPGRLNEEDLARYTAIERPALCQHLTFADQPVRVCGMPPPSSGGLAVAQMLGLLTRSAWFTTLAPQVQEPEVAWAHGFTEASRLAYADRAAYVADPAFVTAPGGDWQTLLAPAYLSERSRALPATPLTPSMRTAPAGQPGGQPMAWAPMPDQPERGTTHLSVVDGRGLAVSLTSSIESSMGARIMVGGFLLNNQLTDFSFQPRDAAGRPIANRVEAGKRPRSSMSPTLVLDARDNRVLAVVGSPGGSLIIPYVAQTLLALLKDRLPAQDAVSLPHVASLNGPTLIESDRFSPAWQQQLQTLGAPVQPMPMVSGLHLLVNQGSARTPLWTTGIDPRREGAAAGD